MPCARLLAGLLAAVLACGCPGAQAGRTEDGQAAFDAGDYPAALAAWQKAAAGGDPRAQLGLGVLYDLGEGVGQDAATALRWYRRAADAGLPDAELNVAVMYDSGRGTARDATAAALWYGRAAAHHDARAAYDLAQLYETGDGVPRNPALADAWLREAAASGLGAAGDRLAHPPAAAAALPPGTLPPPVPCAPADGASIPRLSETRQVELVWTMPPQVAATRFYVEILATGIDPPVPMFAGYTDVSAILGPVMPAHGTYVWRVYAVAATLRSYAPSPWSRFGVIWRGSEGAG